MDIETLAKSIGTLLAPAIPYLLDGGRQVSNGLLDKIGSDAWEKATQVWTKIKIRLVGNTAASEAIAALKADPSNKDDRDALVIQIRKILKTDSILLDELLEATADPVMQKLIATDGSWIEGVEQIIEGAGTKITQIARADTHSTILNSTQKVKKS